MTREQEYIDEVAKYVQKYAPQYKINVYSPIIAQFCLECGYGTSNKVKKVLPDGTVDWRHNYAGLKWRDGRCAISNDYFEEGTAEQNKDGSYSNISSRFYRFKSLEDCVIGYFQFTNISAYANLKGVTDPETYLKNIKADKYATSINYVQQNMNIIKKWNLTKYDPINNTTDSSNPSSLGLYRVQCGAYSVESSANTLATRLKNAGFDAIVNRINNLYKVQIGAFSKKENATELMNKVKAKGFTATIVYDLNNSESKTETIEKENTTAMGKYKVAVDAGHGANTAGKRTVDGYREHWINVKCANYFDIAMKRCGIETVKIAWNDTNATDDTDVALAARQSQIKKAKCDISVSWHANAHGSGTAWTTGQGIETLIHNDASKVGDSRKLADKVQSQLIKGTTQKNRGVKSQSLAMCNCTAMGTKASILIEVGFMTNEYEAQLLKTDAFCLECAEEAAKGVCEYLGVAYKASNTTVVETSTPSTPTPSTKTTVTYTTHRISTNSWGSEITGYNLENSMGYSGSFGKEIDKFTAKLSEGKITYTVHRDGKWGGEINGYSKTDTNNYAGSSNKPIDAIAIKAEGINGKLKYRVHRKTDNKWGGWITGYSKTDTNNYAGSFGKPIDAIQIGIE